MLEIIVGTAIGTLVGGLVTAPSVLWWQRDRMKKLENRISILEAKGSPVYTQFRDGSGNVKFIPDS